MPITSPIDVSSLAYYTKPQTSFGQIVIAVGILFVLFLVVKRVEESVPLLEDDIPPARLVWKSV